MSEMGPSLLVSRRGGYMVAVSMLLTPLIFEGFFHRIQIFLSLSRFFSPELD